MSSNPQHSWDESNIVDDVAFQEQDAELFKNLLNKKEVHDSNEAQAATSGSILKGKIVEITKDHVVIDVGLKSEGLVPIEQFSDPSVIQLGGDVEVFLDQPEAD